jgi:putative peptidoglycan lipid II flippase
MLNSVEKPAGASIRQIARAAGTVMFAFVISNLAGLARQILVARAFGTNADIEAFNAANRVSESLFTLVAGGALASAFIPTFTGLLTYKKDVEAWRLASGLFNLILAAMVGTLGVAALLAPQIIRYVLAPGFANDPLKEALAIDLLRLMLPSAALFGVSGLVMGILNAHQKFLAPALTPAMYQLGLIIGVLVLAPDLGIYGLGWGVLIGSALHLGLQIPSLLRLKGVYTPSFGLELPSLRQVALLLGPRLMGVAVVQLNFWINTRLASQMVEGSVTSVANAFTLMLMPQAAIAQSVAQAALPTLSAHFARGEMSEVRAALGASLRGMLLLAVPASIGLIMLREPIIVFLYQRGAFNARSTELVSWALLWYAAGLVGHCIVEVLARAFYALQDTKTPVLIGTVAMLLNIVFSFGFAELFTRLHWLPHGGLALANSIATALEAIGLYILIRKRLSGLADRSIISGIGFALLGSAAMGVFLWGWIEWTKSISIWLIAPGGVAVGGVVYFTTVYLIGAREARRLSWQVWRLISQRR